MTSERRLYSVKDFEFLNELGEGSYGIVKLAVEKETRLHYAVKILDQAQIVKEKKSDHAIRERDFLNTLRHPFILTLYSTFRDSLHLYYLLEYCPNGELKKHLKSVGSFSEDCAAFYAAEIFTALEFIHSKNVIHRDLKPENILLDKNMHIKLIDFATAKNIDPTTPQQRKNSFCGTPEYVSPEVLGEKPLGIWSDLWSFGCLLFHLLNGKPPFTANTQWDIFKNINERQLAFPNDFSSEARDLIDQLLIVDYEDRLGSREGGHQEIKNHPFFKKRNLNWDSLHLLKPPEIRGRHDTRPIKKDSKPKSFDQITDSVWNRFLYPNEVIIYTGLVWKKKGLFSKKRQLILTNLPRLFYVDPVNFIQRGEVPWDETTFPEYKSHKMFHVVTPSRTYIFEDIGLEARIWVEKIKALTHRLTPQNLG